MGKYRYEFFDGLTNLNIKYTIMIFMLSFSILLFFHNSLTKHSRAMSGVKRHHHGHRFWPAWDQNQPTPKVTPPPPTHPTFSALLTPRLTHPPITAATSPNFPTPRPTPPPRTFPTVERTVATQSKLSFKCF